LVENWYDTALEFRQDRFVFTGWKSRTNMVSGHEYGELVLEPDVGQADDGDTPPLSRSPFRPRSGPSWNAKPNGEDDLEDDSIPF
jgi:hypothetical protein